MSEERKQGHSALRWNRAKGKIEKFDPNPRGLIAVILRRLTNRCTKCGCKRTLWGHGSGAYVCPKCDLNP
jgi:hypothetical protein